MATEDISTLQIKVRSDGITENTNKLNKLADAAEKAEKATKKLGTNVISSSMSGATGATTALTTAILMLSNNITTLTTHTSTSTTATRAHTNAMRDAHAAARGLTGSLGALWLTYGNIGPLMAGAAIGASFKQIISQGSELEHTLSMIQIKGAETAESMAKVRETVLSIGQGIYGPQQVAGALETLVLAGLKAEEAVAAIGPALNLATVGGTTIEKAAYTLVQVGSAMGYTADSFSGIGDVIAKTAAVSMSSVESLSEAFKSASSVGVVYGVTLNDLGASLAALSNLGIQGSAAGTSIKNFYKELDSDAKKVTGTLAALGVNIERDLKVDGKFKDIGAVMEALSVAVQKAGDKGGKAMQAFTNERGMRTMSALFKLYQTEVKGASNGLDELRKKIDDSAGYVAIGAAQAALTSKNQMQSTLNALKVSFAETFESMSPQINVVAHELKKMFKSDEFKSGLRTVATDLSYLITTFVKALPTLIAVGKAFIAIKVGMVTAAAFRSLAVGITTFTAATTAATAGALSLSVALPALGVVLGVAAAAWALYNFHKSKSLDTSQTQAAISTNAELIDSLKAEADRLDVANKNLAENTSLKEANAKTTKELALAEMTKRNKDAELAAEKQFRAAYADVDKSNPHASRIAEFAKKNIVTMDSDIGRSVRAYQNWQAAVNNTANSMREFEVQLNRVQTASDKNEELTNAKLKEEQEKQRKAAELLATAAGNPDVGGDKDDAKVKARVAKIQNEANELDRLRAGYEARTEAVLRGAEGEERVMARVQAARLEATKSQYSAQEYSMLMAKAEAADRAKFEQQKANAITENANKITEILQREAAYRAAAVAGDSVQIGMIEKKTVAIMRFNGATEAQIAAERVLAREADEVLKREAARQKLVTATGSSKQRAEGLMDEAEAMLAYGGAARQTAVQLAQAEIAKSKLSVVKLEDQVVINQRLEAAGVEDLARAYNNLARLKIEMSERELVNAQVGRDGVIGAETAKVAAHYEATRNMIESDKLRAKSGLEAALKGGNAEIIAKAKADYAKVVALSKEAGRLIADNLTVDMKIAGLKDVANAFGDLSKAANKFGDAFAHVGKAFAGLEVGFNRMAEANAREGISDAERTQARVGAYGEMAGAAADFFQEGSKGYNTLMGVSKIFHAAEMAMGLVRMGQLAIGAVLTQGMGDPYTAFARMAAMATIVAGLGFAVGGGFNSNKGGKSAADMQKEQGAGGVFGDAEKKSESILKSMEILKANSDTSLPISQDMLKSLRNIEASMVGLTNLVVRTPGITDGSNMGIQTGKIGSGNGMNAFQNTLMGTNALGGGASGAVIGMILGGPIGAAIGAVLGGTVGKALGKLWGSTKQNIVDSGLSFGGKVSDLQSGEGFNQYASVDTTKKSAFGLKKKTTNRVEFEGLNDELSSQFGLIFTNLETTLVLAATALGKEGAAVSKAINDMVIDTTSVSLKGLKGQELQDALNSVISKTMDEIAAEAFPAMGAFRQVGEGYAQTVVRVATGVEQAQVALKGFGITAIAYTDIINKTGDVGYELVQQSIALKEAGSGVGAVIANVVGSVSELSAAYKELITMRAQMESMNLGSGLSADTINGAGGAKELSTALSSYYEKFFSDTERAAIEAAKLTKEFGVLGYALPSSRDQLRSWVESAAKAGDQTTVGGLLKLADAFAELGEQAGSMVPTVESMLDTAMQNLTKAVEAEKKRQEKLYKEQTEAARKSYEATMTSLKLKADADKAYVKAQSDAINEQVKQTQKVMTALATAVKATAPILSQAEAYANAMRTAKGGLQAVASGKSLGGVAGLEDAVKELAKPSEAMYSSLIDYQRGQAEANVVLDSLERAGTKQLSDAEKQLLALEAINTSNERAISAEELRYKEEQEKLEARHQARMEALDKTLEMAQMQIDVLLGIDTSIQTMAQALANFQMAVGNAAATKANGAPNATAAIESLYRNLLGRKSDAGGLKFWEEKMAGGATLAQIQEGFMNSAEYKERSALSMLPKFDVGTNFVPEDMPAIVHKGERIIPAADNAELLRREKEGDKESSSASNERVVAKIEQLIQVVMTGDVANAQKTNDLYKLIRDWDGRGMPPVRSEEE